jgi:Arc/MetJ family transcription regulator
MARTNIVLDDRLIGEAMRVSGARTKREAVDTALRAYVARASAHRALRRLKGRLAWAGDIDGWRRSRP